MEVWKNIHPWTMEVMEDVISALDITWVHEKVIKSWTLRLRQERAISSRSKNLHTMQHE